MKSDRCTIQQEVITLPIINSISVPINQYLSNAGTTQARTDQLQAESSPINTLWQQEIKSEEIERQTKQKLGESTPISTQTENRDIVKSKNKGAEKM